MEVSTVRNVVENYMKDKNYYKLYDNGLNAIYCKDEEDKKLFYEGLSKISNKSLLTIDTGHPLD